MAGVSFALGYASTRSCPETRDGVQAASSERRSRLISAVAATAHDKAKEPLTCSDQEQKKHANEKVSG
jgi:hypothetical protein